MQISVEDPDISTVLKSLADRYMAPSIGLHFAEQLASRVQPKQQRILRSTVISFIEFFIP